MHRNQKFKKRRYGRQKWNLKNYWKFRGIGVKLHVIKEEAAKEYLAEIENDDSLQWDLCADQPNHILLQKKSETYFGLSKFPANFSPSELALQRLCHGHTLHQTFPTQTKTIPTTISTSTITETNFAEETSKTTPHSLQINNETSNNKSPEKKISAHPKTSINQNIVKQKHEKIKYRKNRRFGQKTSRYKKKSSRFNRMRKNHFNQPNNFDDQINSTFFPDREISIKKSLLKNSAVDSSICDSILPNLKTDFENAPPKSHRKSTSNVKFPHQKSNTEQTKSCCNLSSIPQFSSIKFDPNESHLNQINVDTSSRYRSILRGSTFGNVGTTNFGSFHHSLIEPNVGKKKFAKIKSQPCVPVAVPTPQAGHVRVPTPGAGPVIVPTPEAGPVIVPVTGAGPVTVPTLVAGPVIVPATGAGPVILPTLVAGPVIVPTLVAGPVTTVPTLVAGPVIVPTLVAGPVTTVPTPGADPVRVPTPAAGSVRVPTPGADPVRVPAPGADHVVVPTSRAGPVAVPAPGAGAVVVPPNSLVNMSGTVQRLFDCCTADVEGGVSYAPARFMSAAGSSRWGGDTGRVTRRRRIVQLDHKSLWTDFVSDMIVNSRVRNMRIDRFWGL